MSNNLKFNLNGKIYDYPVTIVNDNYIVTKLDRAKSIIKNYYVWLLRNLDNIISEIKDKDFYDFKNESIEILKKLIIAHNYIFDNINKDIDIIKLENIINNYKDEYKFLTSVENNKKDNIYYNNIIRWFNYTLDELKDLINKI